MKIKWKIGISGTVHNRDQGVRPGDVMELDDAEAVRYIGLGYAEAVQKVEHAVSPPSNEERAVLSTEIVGASDKPVPQPKAPRPPKVEPEPKIVTTNVPTPTKRVTTPVRRPRK